MYIFRVILSDDAANMRSWALKHQIIMKLTSKKRSLTQIGLKWHNIIKIIWHILTNYFFLLFQHFCVFTKGYLKTHEPAWIPINYGSRVQKESLKKFRKVSIFAWYFFIPLFCIQKSFFQAIRMLCVIIVVFVLCWTPYLTFNILQSFGFVHAQLRGITKHLKTAITLMAYLNR